MSDQYLENSQEADDLQRELDEALGSMNIGSLMEADQPISAPITPGVRRGQVVSIQKNDIFVDMGGKDRADEGGDGVLRLSDRHDHAIGLGDGGRMGFQ